MATDRNARKLTTVLATDVAGYSRLMSDDEAATVKTLNEFLGIFYGLIERHDGRVINTAGDGFIAEFSSPVEAMRSAIAVQEELGVRNEELPEHRRMHFRIGINVGDVIVEDDQMFGDAVNIAARLEALAAPGKICISGSAYEHVKNRLTVGFHEEGAQTVKNIPYPVPAYTVVAGQGGKGSALAGGKRKPNLVLASLVGLVLVGGAGAGAWALFGDDQAARERQLQQQKAADEKRKAEEAEARRKRDQALLLARQKAEEAERKRLAAEKRLREAEEARRKAEAEARRRELEEAKRQAAAEARRKAEAEAQKRLKALEEARRKAEEEARRRREEEARRKAAEEAKRKAEEAARRKAEEEAKRKAAEEAAKKKAEEEAKQKAAAAAVARRRAAAAQARRRRQLAQARRGQGSSQASGGGAAPNRSQSGTGGGQASGVLSPAQIRQTLVGRTAAFRRKHRRRPGYLFFLLSFSSASRFTVQCRYQESQVRQRGSGQPCRLNGRSFSWSQSAAGACWSINRPVCFRVARAGRFYRFIGGGFFAGRFFLR